MRDGLRLHALRFARLALAALALGVAGPATADDPEEWERDAGPDEFYVSPTNTDGVTTHVVIRVVDHATGEPIPGASAALFAQDAYPITGLAPPDRMGFADAEGWIRIRADDLGWTPTWQIGYWKYVEAPGHAGVAVYPGDDEGEVRLSRPRAAIVEVRDVLDHPVAGATIGGRDSNTCGHMPDQRIAVTGLDGRAVMLGVAPSERQRYAFEWECWAVHPSIESTYHYLEFSSRPGHVQILRHDPSHPIEGTILDADGKPVADAWVGGNGMHRGPWTRTNSNGWFRLEGSPRIHWLSVDAPDAPTGDGAPATPGFRAPPAGVHRTFRLPPRSGATTEPAEHPVEIVVRDATTREEIDRGVPLVAVREADGCTVTPVNGEIQALPPGAWTVLVGGGASPWASARLRLDVSEAKDAPPAKLLVDAVRNAEVRFQFAGDPWKATVELVTATDVRPVTPEELNARAIPVPADGECAFRVSYPAADSSKSERWLYTAIPVEARRPGAAPLRIAEPAPVTISAKLAGPDGKTVLGWLASDLASLVDSPEFATWDPEASARLSPEIAVYAEGSIDLLAIPEDRALAPRVVTVTLPPGSIEGGRVDAGLVRLEPRGDRSLRVLLPDGKPAEYSQLRVVRDGIVRNWHPREEPTVFDPPLVPLAEGDVVEVLGAWWGKAYLPPIRHRLEGPGPWTIRNDLPDTSIVVDPTDEHGKPMGAMLVIDGKPLPTEAYTDDDGKRHAFEVAGLAPGPHRIAIGAKGRVTRLYRVVLKAGEHRTLAAVLRPQAPRPAPPPPPDAPKAKPAEAPSAKAPEAPKPEPPPKDPAPPAPGKPGDAPK